LFCCPFLPLFAGLDALKKRKILDEGLYRYDLAEAGPKYDLSTYFVHKLERMTRKLICMFRTQNLVDYIFKRFRS